MYYIYSVTNEKERKLSDVCLIKVDVYHSFALSIYCEDDWVEVLILSTPRRWFLPHYIGLMVCLVTGLPKELDEALWMHFHEFFLSETTSKFNYLIYFIGFILPWNSHLKILISHVQSPIKYAQCQLSGCQVSPTGLSRLSVQSTNLERFTGRCDVCWVVYVPPASEDSSVLKIISRLFPGHN